jgi:hypothetical protein
MTFIPRNGSKDLFSDSVSRYEGYFFKYTTSFSHPSVAEHLEPNRLISLASTSVTGYTSLTDAMAASVNRIVVHVIRNTL